MNAYEYYEYIHLLCQGSLLLGFASFRGKR